MAKLTEMTENVNIHQTLPDQPALTAEELKSKFDEGANKIKTYLNETLVDELTKILTSLENKDATLTTSITAMKTLVDEATRNITSMQEIVGNLKSGATTKISSGSTAPTSLEEGEIYLQYF